jgi:phosphoribosyl-AMP cyclohydrolase
MELFDQIKYDSQGLVPVVIQDWQNGEVLMVAYMNRESLKTTLETGKTHFWSRSRQKFWMKGESSGHTQQVKEVCIDCDADCVLIKVEQIVAACHTGFRSCFYRKWESGNLVTVGEKMFEEEDVYKKG